MNMDNYLKSIEYAVKSTLKGIWQHFDEYDCLSERAISLSKKSYPSKILGITEDARINNIHIVVPKVIPSFCTQEEIEVFELGREMNRVKGKIYQNLFSINSLSSDLLQKAKQGFSIVYGHPDSWPNGRALGSQWLKSIILQGRNQASHWEERKKKQNKEDKIKDCYMTLFRESGNLNFGMHRSKSLAFETVDLLGWRSFDDFKADMMPLGSQKSVM